MSSAFISEELAMKTLEKHQRGCLRLFQILHY